MKKFWQSVNQYLPTFWLSVLLDFYRPNSSVQTNKRDKLLMLNVDKMSVECETTSNSTIVNSMIFDDVLLLQLKGHINKRQMVFLPSVVKSMITVSVDNLRNLWRQNEGKIYRGLLVHFYFDKNIDVFMYKWWGNYRFKFQTYIVTMTMIMDVENTKRPTYQIFTCKMSCLTLLCQQIVTR